MKLGVFYLASESLLLSCLVLYYPLRNTGHTSPASTINRACPIQELSNNLLSKAADRSSPRSPNIACERLLIRAYLLSSTEELAIHDCFEPAPISQVSELYYTLSATGLLKLGPLNASLPPSLLQTYRQARALGQCLFLYCPLRKTCHTRPARAINRAFLFKNSRTTYPLGALMFNPKAPPPSLSEGLLIRIYLLSSTEKIVLFRTRPDLSDVKASLRILSDRTSQTNSSMPPFLP